MLRENFAVSSFIIGSVHVISAFSLALFLCISFSVLTSNAAAAETIRGTDIRYEILLNTASGLPAQLDIESDDPRLDKVRMLLVVDGHLLTVPMKRLGGGKFRGVFPTPGRSLTSQFQLFYEGGRTELTDVQAGDELCRFPVSAGRASQAVALDDEIVRLQYFSRMLSDEEGE